MLQLNSVVAACSHTRVWIRIVSRIVRHEDRIGIEARMIQWVEGLRLSRCFRSQRWILGFIA